MTATPRKLDNYQLITLLIQQPQSRYFFPDLPNLRDAKVYYMTFYTRYVMRSDVNGTSSGLLSTGAFLTLVRGNDEFVKQMDLHNLAALKSVGVNSNVNGGLAISPTQINFSKSYVELSPALVPGSVFSYSFGVWYKK